MCGVRSVRATRPAPRAGIARGAFTARRAKARAGAAGTRVPMKCGSAIGRRLLVLQPLADVFSVSEVGVSADGRCLRKFNLKSRGDNFPSQIWKAVTAIWGMHSAKWLRLRKLSSTPPISQVVHNASCKVCEVVVVFLWRHLTRCSARPIRPRLHIRRNRLFRIRWLIFGISHFSWLLRVL